MNLLTKALRVLREEGPRGVARRVWARFRKHIHAREPRRVEDPIKVRRWQGLKDKYRGERAFLVGNGPSLNRTPLHLLAGEMTLCFNRFYLMFERLAWRPTMYMCVDERVAEDTADELNEVVGDVQHAFFPDLHPSGTDFRQFIHGADNLYWLSVDWGGFHQDLPHVGMGGTVANAGLQVLCYLGFSPIYLIGVDMDYKDHRTAKKEDERNWTSVKDDDPNHFDPRYFGKGRKYHYPRVEENMLPSMYRAREVADEMGVQILNAGIGGALEAFPRVDFRSLFDVSAEDELKMLLAAVGSGNEGETLAQAFPEAARVQGADDWDVELELAVTDSATAQTLIPKVILTHLPYGPFADECLFVKRETAVTVV